MISYLNESGSRLSRRASAVSACNEPAIRFYERVGMHLAAVRRGAIAESRKLKPEIGLLGVGGRPIEDELEFELKL